MRTLWACVHPSGKVLAKWRTKRMAMSYYDRDYGYNFTVVEVQE